MSIEPQDHMPSPFNEKGRAQLQGCLSLQPPEQVFIADCTLRDGEQQAGVVMDKESKLQIAKALHDLGVFEIEAGMPASGEEDKEAIAAMQREIPDAKISVFARALQKDVDEAMELGVWGIRLSLPISSIQREHKLKGISDDEYLERALEITTYARERGLYVIFSPFDTTRADIEFVRKVASTLQEAKTVDRLRIVDTTGCATPEGISYLVHSIRQAAPQVPLEIHVHDDFGLACANTIAGVMAGATFVSTTVNGIGERSGNAATEEVVMALEALYGIDTGIKLDRLKSVSAQVEKLSGVELQVHKPVVGVNSFRHEAGMIVSGLLKEPFTAESYKPHVVGQQRQILIGKKSGLASIRLKLEELNIDADEDKLPSLLQAVKVTATEKRRALTDEEFRDVASNVT
jgi:isopropylmalate/homocitrate/citramalate synthase